MKRKNGLILSSGTTTDDLGRTSAGISEITEIFYNTLWPSVKILNSEAFINEGQTISIKLINVPDGTYTANAALVSGTFLNTSDFQSNLNTFSIVVSSGVGTGTTTLALDGFTEGTEVINFIITNSSSVTIGTTQNYTISDISTGVTEPAFRSPFSPSALEGLGAYLRLYVSEYRNPSFYSYTLDGDSTYILDGGGDMYDAGNYTYPVYHPSNQDYSASSAGSNQGGYALSYGTANSSNASTTTDINFIYNTLGYSSQYLPLTLLAYRTGSNQIIGFQKGGNSGADGGGILGSGMLYTQSLINGFTVWAFRRETYGAGDPSHCDLYILIGHSSWNSVYGLVQYYADPVSNGGNGGRFFMQQSTNVLAIVTLLSKSGGAEVTAAECQTVVNALLNRIKLYLS